MKEKTISDAELARALRAFGHPVRLDILRILVQRCDPECCCTDVTQCLPLAQSTVSQHIKVLLEAGLVERHARGTRNCYSVRTERIESLRQAYQTYLAGLLDTQTQKAPESV